MFGSKVGAESSCGSVGDAESEWWMLVHVGGGGGGINISVIMAETLNKQTTTSPQASLLEKYSRCNELNMNV
jgi:hypothetical protein